MGRGSGERTGWLLAGGVAAAGLGAALARSAWECRTLMKSRYWIKDRKITKPCTMVFLSDLHGNRFGKKNRELIDAILVEGPAAVLIGGDMMVVKSRRRMDYSALEEILQGIGGRVPVFYAEGNHEQRMRLLREDFPGWYEAFMKLLERYGVRLLNDETVMAAEEIAVSALEIEPEYYGKIVTPAMPRAYIGAHLHGHFSPKKTLFAKPDGSPFRILMAHTPQYMKRYWQYGTDLVLSGHYHGGTMVLPVLGPVISPQFQVFPAYARGYYADDSGEKRAVVSAGLGTHSVNIRLFNRPELIVLHFDAED